MANRTNIVIISGNLTRDAEVRTTQSGDNSVKFGMAWNRQTKQQDGTYADRPEYFDCECWMTDAQLRCVQPRLLKGAPVTIVGRLEQQTWKTQEGNRSKVVVRVTDPIAGIVFEERKAAQGAKAPAQAPVAPQPQYAPAQQQYAPQQAPHAAYAPQGYQPQMQFGQQPYQQQVVQPPVSVYEDEIPF